MSEPRPENTYRHDIDGLRAVAVLLVVVFHAAPDALPGGFIGVDVFFVISGYLITSIIASELQANRFTLQGFYVRRIKRIFPALVLVLAFCLLAGWWLLLADEYAQLGKHVAAGAGFVSNLAQWYESGYFDQEAIAKPLLHLWSLGVEEQFYFFWPLVLWLIWRHRLPPWLMLGGLLVVSFLTNLLTLRHDASGAYYLPWNRFWELMAGGLLAMAPKRPSADPRTRKISTPWLPHAMSVLGGGAIVTGLAFITEESSFPGWWAWLPVAGGLLLIASGPYAVVNRWLSWRPVVFVGLISYPLYLWHWPLLSFAHILHGQTPPDLVRLGVVMLAVLLSVLTYVLVERPLRFGRRSPQTVALLAAGVALMGSGGMLTWLQTGIPDRAHAKAQVAYVGDTYHHAIFTQMSGAYHVCQPKSLADHADRWKAHVRCMQTQADRDVEIALVGDSHVEHLFLGLAELYPERNLAYYLKVGAAFDGNPDFAEIFAHIERTPSIRYVVFTMSWQRRMGKVPKGSTLEAEILKVARRFMARGKQVYITTDVPHFPFDPNKCRLHRPLALATDNQCSADLPVHPVIAAALQNVVKKESDIRLIDTYRHLCSGANCSMVNGRELLYRDRTHLNVLGSRFIGKAIVADHPDLFESQP